MSIGTSVSSTPHQIFKRRRPRCALIEFNYYHGETMPTIVRCLNALGADVQVYCNERLRHNDPFVYTQGLSYGLHDVEDLSGDDLNNALSEFDLVIINSLEPKENLTKVKGLQMPVIGVMHNGGLAITDRDYADFFGAPSRKALVMARHISDFISQRTNVQWISPIELGTVRDPLPATGFVTFCVQGNLHADRRNYGALVNAVSSITARGIKNFKVLIIGRNDTATGDALREAIRSRHLDAFFEFSEGELRYFDYYGSIARSDFLLPLVDPNLSDHAAYFRDKLSTTMQIALAFQIIPIVHGDLATAYGVENESFTYSTNWLSRLNLSKMRGGLKRAMLAALNAPQEDLVRMRSGLSRKRDELLNHSTENLRSLLDELTIGESRKPNSSAEANPERHAHPHN